MSSTTSRKVGGGDREQDTGGRSDASTGGMGVKLAFAWAFVGIPLLYGIYETAQKAAALFTG